MYLVTAEQMRELDRRTIEELGIPAVALMENAGRAIAEEVVALCRRRGPGGGRDRGNRWSNGGSSGGDGGSGGGADGSSNGSSNCSSSGGNGGNGGNGSSNCSSSGGNGGNGGNGSSNCSSSGGNGGSGGNGSSNCSSSGGNRGNGGNGSSNCSSSGGNGGNGVSGDAAAAETARAHGERAGFQVSGDNALTLAHADAERWFILVGKGNNGGDGLAAARHLREAGIAATLVYAVPPESLTGVAALQRDAAAALGLPALQYGRDRLDLAEGSGIVDALLGTGAAGAPRGAYAELIAAANRSGKAIVSADIPSGLDADTGATHEPCIQASVTVCLALLKRGLVQYPGAAAAGRVVVRSIGIPSSLAGEEDGVSAHLLTPEVLQQRLGVDVTRRRSPEGHKGTYGHVLLAGGTLRMSGAGLLSARAALRAGAGLVTWALPQQLLPYVAGAAPELMLAPAEDGGAGVWNAATADELLRLSGQRDVLAIGPGLGRFAGDTEWLRRLWEGTACPLVLDADALNILAEADYSGWAQRKHPVILTPHPGEMARLAGRSTAEVQADRIGLALAYAAEHQVTLVLKGAHTVIATSEGQAYVNTTGHPGMGTGGAGDVLTGVISGLLAQGLNAAQAAAFGVYLHGEAGEKAACERGNPASLIAGDIIEAL
ncbi:NAD(P)H-hydrate dehydratase [Paenibacillus donghaensis]|uniref:Multifunctional fusion protein n=1 Tax=Paenibacillus donghaensis TaxID=414771 RepID=A0A2Z2KNV4_9BACL|nr:NAD(P)H-hydrate dehydratase [Paenibacillus donghaensis]ASA25360.1 bifunctional ADP-dependent NAD(P)H-hydrate dehydratase/NAD(P)H-hydrate epimerase [Paenibacillus donghaensis]